MRRPTTFLVLSFLGSLAYAQSDATGGGCRLRNSSNLSGRGKT